MASWLIRALRKVNKEAFGSKPWVVVFNLAEREKALKSKKMPIKSKIWS